MITIEDLTRELDRLESEAYGLSLDATPDECDVIFIKADNLFSAVEEYFGVSYWNPGEPWCTNSQFKIPVTSTDAGNNGGLRTYEEDRAEREAYDAGITEPLLDHNLYWARLRLAQAHDLIEDGWQSAGEDYDEVKFAWAGGEFARNDLPEYCTFATDEQMEEIARLADEIMENAGHHSSAVLECAAYNVIGHELEDLEV